MGQVEDVIAGMLEARILGHLETLEERIRGQVEKQVSGLTHNLRVQVEALSSRTLTAFPKSEYGVIRASATDPLSVVRDPTLVWRGKDGKIARYKMKKGMTMMIHWDGKDVPKIKVGAPKNNKEREEKPRD